MYVVYVYMHDGKFEVYMLRYVHIVRNFEGIMAQLLHVELSVRDPLSSQRFISR